jgi:phosphoserine aminotransferase
MGVSLRVISRCIMASAANHHGRVHNFNAGPAGLPQSVLQIAAAEMLNYKNTGMGVMELSHRSKAFEAILAAASQDLRNLLQIPNNYKILFMQGGATLQFAALPLNFLPNSADSSSKPTADYIVTGAWSQAAAEEAKKYINVNIVANNSSNSKQLNHIPAESEFKYAANAAYLHYCHNETVHGIQFQSPPSNPHNVPLIGDYSSCFCSEPISEISKYAVIYAGAQKNVGPAGLTIVIIDEKYLQTNRIATCPIMLDYKQLVEKDSMYNTPPCYAIYMTGLVFKWLINEQEGLAAMQVKSIAKSKRLYDYIDSTNGFYNAFVQPNCRSKMNVVFILKNSNLTAEFIKASENNHLIGLAGHRSVGGMRASLYNAVSEADVEALISFMKSFNQQHSQ